MDFRRVTLVTLLMLSPLPAYPQEFRLCPSDVELFVLKDEGDATSLYIELTDEAGSRLFSVTNKAIGEKLIFVDDLGHSLVENDSTIQSAIRKNILFSFNHEKALELQQYLQQGRCVR